jgi:LacI family transcriptional regulator
MPRPSSKKAKHVRAATLADVGRAAGVSAMAASAVLNGARTSSRISPETRERIVAAASKLSYRPNAAARALANRRMDTIGVAAVITDGELNHYFLEVFNGILEGAARHNQNATVFALHDWAKDPERLHRFCDGRIDGLILLAPTFHEDHVALPAHTPFVSIHANIPVPGMLNIESDEERGAYEITRRLLVQGHRRIMHLAGPNDLIGPQRRIRGYQRALASLRQSFDPELLVPAGFNAKDGAAALRQWLRRHEGQPLPDAVFCVNDSVAIGCIEALAEAGLRVPDDVSVAGFDDSLAARMCVPQLSTVRQPLRAMGARAVDVLLNRIGKPSSSAGSTDKAIVFPVELIHRASVAAASGAERLVPRLR